MILLDTLDKKYGKYIPENLTYYLIVGQIGAYILSYTAPEYAKIFTLNGQLLFEGQWWRLISFLFTPITDNIIFAAFAWYIMYLYGVVLERKWGSLRYLVYLSISYLGCVLAAFLFPASVITNTYIYTSLFLAFAYLYPDFQLLLFFILPVKVKWLGIIAWIGILLTILTGEIPTKILTVLSVMNFLLFFGRDIFTIQQSGKPKLIPLQQPDPPGIKNICGVCKKNQKDYRQVDFRYCTDCNPPACYCEDHIEKHTHKKKS